LELRESLVSKDSSFKAYIPLNLFGEKDLTFEADLLLNLDEKI